MKNRDILFICSEIMKVSEAVEDTSKRQELVKELLSEILVISTKDQDINNTDKNTIRIPDVDQNIVFLSKVRSEFELVPNREWCTKIIDDSIRIMNNQTKIITKLLSQLRLISNISTDKVDLSDIISLISG